MTRAEQVLQANARKQGRDVRAASITVVLVLLLLTATTGFSAYNSVLARRQSQTNSELFARLDAQDIEAAGQLAEQQRVADAAVTRLIRDNRKAAEERQRVLLDLLNQQLDLIAAEVRDPENQEGRAVPTLVPSPTPGPTFTPRPAPTPRHTVQSSATPTAGPARPGCLVPFLPVCLPSP